jgi:hypothetical protein
VVDDITAPGGLRPLPDAADLRRFVDTASSMDGLRIAELLRVKMVRPMHNVCVCFRVHCWLFSAAIAQNLWESRIAVRERVEACEVISVAFTPPLCGHCQQHGRLAHC